MLDVILKTANQYSEGLKHVKEKRVSWLEKHKELKDHLKEIADHLNEHADYKPGYFIDTLRAFNEEINGTCSDLPSVTFRSGDMPMLLNFHNSAGENKDYVEEGFRITFNPAINGEVLVMFLPHHSDLDKTPSTYSTLAIVQDPALLTMEMVDDIINKGIDYAFSTSFTGIGEPEDETDIAEQAKTNQRNPIGFKRYETTERVK